MRVFVIGSKMLSVAMLDALIRYGFDVVGIISRDDEEGMIPWHEMGHPSLKAHAESLDIMVYESWSVNSDKTRQLLRASNLDFIFSCFWGEIFKPETLDIPRFGAYNLHTAYLPQNRGSRPIPWALIDGEHSTGITLHKMISGVDNGPIVSQTKIPILAVDTAKSLYDKVTVAGKELFEKSLPLFHLGEPPMQAQNEKLATYHVRGEPFGGQLHWKWDSDRQQRFRRAFTFPPFRSYRKSPDWIDPEQPRVYWLDASLLREIDASDWEIKYSSKSIGSPDHRKAIKSYLKIDTADGHRLTGLEKGLERLYTPLDVIATVKINFVCSKHYKVQDLSQNKYWPHPYRYENGIIEIPVFEVHDELELNELVSMAEAERVKIKRDIFLNVSPSDIHNGLSKLLLKSGLSQLTFAEVCLHYDTPYEKISS